MKKPPTDKSTPPVISKSAFLKALKEAPPSQEPPLQTSPEAFSVQQWEGTCQDFLHSMPETVRIMLEDVAAVKKINLSAVLRQWVEVHNVDAKWPEDPEEQAAWSRGILGMMAENPSIRAEKYQRPGHRTRPGGKSGRGK